MSTDTNNISLSELEQAKNNLVSHNDEIIKKGFIGDLQRFSGDIIYVENRSPISRATDQIEDVKLIIEFWVIVEF